MTTRSYSELLQIDDYLERFRYLSLAGVVGERTFGSERWMNQDFYTSYEWRQIRHRVIARDYGCDLAMPGHDLHRDIVIHHMNPMTAEQLVHGDEAILDPEYLITCSHRTHNAIHYGDERQLPRQLVERTPGDTKLW